MSRIKPRDPGHFRIWRYKTALMLKRFPQHLDAVPMDEWAAPEDLRDAERAVSAEVNSPLSRAGMTRRRYVGGSQAAGSWAAELCYNGEGKVYQDSLDPRCVRWADGFLEPHAALNPWTITIARMPVAQVKKRKGWKVPADLKGDDLHLTEAGGWSAPFMDSNGQPDRDRAGSGTLVTVVKYRCRFEKPQKQEESRPLDPAMWHLACPACGWKSPGQAEAMQSFPPFVPGGCESCGADVGRVTRVYSPVPETQYGGKKLVICAPFSGHETPFYEGPWEFDYPTFPILYLEAYTLPHRAGGQSDTQVLKTPVLASNALLRLGYETMLRSRPYFYTMRDSIENARGGVFGFDPDEDGDVMYGKGEIPRPPQVIQGTGVNSSLFAMYDRLQSAFRTNESTSELALAPSEIKDAKVGTIEQVTETGNVVIDDHGQQLYDAESLFYTCLAAALRELPSKKRRYQDESGQWQFRNLGGPLMPRVEMRVGASQLLDTLDQSELQAYMTLVQMDPRHRRGFARFAHIPQDVLGQIEADESQGMAMPTPVETAPDGMPMGAGGAPPMPPPQYAGGV